MAQRPLDSSDWTSVDRVPVRVPDIRSLPSYPCVNATVDQILRFYGLMNGHARTEWEVPDDPDGLALTFRKAGLSTIVGQFTFSEFGYYTLKRNLPVLCYFPFSKRWVTVCGIHRATISWHDPTRGYRKDDVSHFFHQWTYDRLAMVAYPKPGLEKILSL